MRAAVTRPIFFEGQRLAATDLDEVVDYGRAKRERHDRYVHRWGIVTGLDLTIEEAPGGNGMRVIAEAGYRSVDYLTRLDGVVRWESAPIDLVKPA